MKKTVLMGSLLCCGWAWAQDAEPRFEGARAEVDPFADDSGLGGGLDYGNGISPERKDRTTATLLIRTEIYELSALDAAKLLDELEEDASKLRATLLNLVDEGKVTLIDINALRTDAGLIATAEGIAETIYPTEYEQPEAPQILAKIAKEDESGSKEGVMERFLQGIANDATPAAFETRNTGATTEVEVRTVDAEKGMWDVRWAPEMVALVGESSWMDGALTMPIFASTRLNQSFRVLDGEWNLAGLAAIGQVEGGINSDRKRIFLLRVKQVR